MGQKLYEHQRHVHEPRNVNEVHAAERLSFNDRLAVWIAAHTGSMICAYIFAGIGIGSLVGVLTNNTLLALLCGSFSSYFLQLVLLPILALGQNILGRHAELQSEEQYTTTQRIFSDSEELVAHLHAQDDLALKQQERMQHVEELLLLLLEHLGVEAEPTTAGEIPVVRFNHEMRVDEDQLRISLTHAGVKPEVLGALPAWMLLALDELRPHAQHAEARHGDV